MQPPTRILRSWPAPGPTTRSPQRLRRPPQLRLDRRSRLETTGHSKRALGAHPGDGVQFHVWVKAERVRLAPQVPDEVLRELRLGRQDPRLPGPAYPVAIPAAALHHHRRQCPQPRPARREPRRIHRDNTAHMQGGPAPVDQLPARQRARPRLHHLQERTASLHRPAPARRIRAATPGRLRKYWRAVTEWHHAIRSQPAVMNLASQVRRTARQQVIQQRTPRPQHTRPRQFRRACRHLDPKPHPASSHHVTGPSRHRRQ